MCAALVLIRAQGMGARRSQYVVDCNAATTRVIACSCWRAWQQADGHTLCVCALLTHILACRVLVAAASQTLGRDTFNTRIDSVEDKLQEARRELQETRKELQETKEDLTKKLEAAQQGEGSRARTITDSMLPVRATA